MWTSGVVCFASEAAKGLEAKMGGKEQSPFSLEVLCVDQSKETNKRKDLFKQTMDQIMIYRSSWNSE